tara:strand:+ start:39 stop:329 length:291 start_codon:yes stop_codon:yes gene_type:complete
MKKIIGEKIHLEDTNFNQHLYVRYTRTVPFKQNAKYTIYYEVVTRFGTPVMYLTKGHPDGPREICVYYRNGKAYDGFGKTFTEAIKNAIRDAVLFM